MKNYILTFRTALLTALLYSIAFAAEGQSRENYIGEWYTRSSSTLAATPANIFDAIQSRSNNGLSTRLQLRQESIDALLKNNQPLINLSIPDGNKTISLNLAKVNVTAQGMTVNTDKGVSAYTPGVHYRGIVNNDPSQICSFSVFDDEVMGFYSTAEGNFVIAKMDDGSNNYAVYNEKMLPSIPSFECGAIDGPATQPNTPKYKTTGVGCKTVNVYFECDYALYQNKGSNVTNVVNYLTGLFNQVSTLYANENISIQISNVFVWTTTDPYASMTTTNAVLNAFQANKGTNFNGDLAHFLTTRNLGGGIAYINVLCNKAYAFGVSMIYSSYSSVPTYSWTIEVVTHELGHNIGSPHTQACSWPGGPIDNCATPEGSCAAGPAPTNGGTIMSYCHLTSYGINFNNGFGYWPGMLLRDKVTNGACLTGSGTAPAGLSTTNVTTSSATLNWVAVSGTTQYTVEYKPSSASTWTVAGTTAGTSINVTGLSAASSYTWHVRTDCSPNSADQVFTTSGGTVCPDPTNLTTNNITPTAADISWGAVAGASTYTVDYQPAGANSWTTTSATNNTTMYLSNLVSGTNYNWKVKANCSGESVIASFTTLSITPGCTAPNSLVANNVTTSSATLAWSPIASAASYTLKIRKVGVNNWSNHNNITATSEYVDGLLPGSTYEWKVASKCGSGNNSDYSPVVSFTTPASIAEMVGGAETINIYPNPAKEVLHISIPAWNADKSATGEIYNAQGAKLMSFSTSSATKEVSIGNLADGLYLISINTGDKKPLTRRFIKASR
jgi:hypothetical protein